MRLTSSQLYDLVKAKKQASQVGKRGGRFYISESGKKVYPGKQTEQKVTLAHVLSMPHTSSSHKQGKVEVTHVAPDPKESQVRERLGNKMKPKPPSDYGNRKRARLYIWQEKQNWPGYFCEGCNAAIHPNHKVALTEVAGWEAKQDKETGEWKREPIIEKVGERTVVKVTYPDGEVAEYQGYHPEAVAKQLCPKCHEQEGVIRTKRSVGRTKVGEAKARRSRKVKKSLWIAL